jgi:hypothetical protein
MSYTRLAWVRPSNAAGPSPLLVRFGARLDDLHLDDRQPQSPQIRYVYVEGPGSLPRRRFVVSTDDLHVAAVSA